jgi:hypothetical protein
MPDLVKVFCVLIRQELQTLKILVNHAILFFPRQVYWE